eukprot:TRINITY_DN469_c0_g2_i8.p1 TRINITY_DN469_c0_g2~~TRINITY_DN469_c0_g2_i8.p1  ORF type:complete len:721 (-),score=60.18 TRINITY_DN469_c0_g2_i8:60-2222(-)
MAAGAATGIDNLVDPLLTSPYVNIIHNDLEETETVVVARLRQDFFNSTVVCILGSATFSEPAHETLVGELAAALGPLPLTFITGGMAGVEKTFASNLAHVHKLVHVRPFGHPSGFEWGRDAFAGRNEDETRAIIGAIGDIYITVEGGQGVAFEATAAYKRGALVLPLIRTGGASSGMFNFPQEALRCPGFIKLRNRHMWELIRRHDVPIEKTVEAVYFFMECYSKKAVMLQPYLWLPKWVVHPDVQRFAEDWISMNTREKALPLGVVCGRGIFWACTANCIMWPAYVFFTVLAYKTCACSPYGGLARYDTRLWSIFLMFWISQFYFEIKAMSYALYCQVQATGPFTFLGIRLRFRQWFGMMIGISIVAHMDICSNSFFLATAVYSQSCPTALMTEIWGNVIKQSMFQHVDGLLNIHLTIPSISLAVWLLTFIQPIHAFGLGVPCCQPGKFWPPMFCWNVQYEPRAYVEGEAPPRNSYRTCLSAKQNHGNALMATSEVARMASVTYQDESFAMSRFNAALEVLDEMMQSSGEVPVEQAVRCLQHAVGLAQRSQFRFFIQGVLEMGCMLNLQISLLGIQRCSTGKRMRSPEDTGFFNSMASLNWQIMLSILLSTFMALRRFNDMHSLFKKCMTITQDIIQRTSKSTSTWFLLGLFVQSTSRDDKLLQREFRRVRRWMLINFLLGVLYTVVVWYALMKFWAVFYCPSSLWNLAVYPPDGCVQF